MTGDSERNSSVWSDSGYVGGAPGSNGALQLTREYSKAPMGRLGRGKAPDGGLSS